jgi:hypothetical protein
MNYRQVPDPLISAAESVDRTPSMTTMEMMANARMRTLEPARARAEGTTAPPDRSSKDRCTLRDADCATAAGDRLQAAVVAAQVGGLFVASDSLNSADPWHATTAPPSGARSPTLANCLIGSKLASGGSQTESSLVASDRRSCFLPQPISTMTSSRGISAKVNYFRRTSSENSCRWNHSAREECE